MMESFKDRFEIALKEKHMTQAYISEKTGIAHGTISNYVRGKYAPKSDKRKMIAEVLRVNEACNKADGVQYGCESECMN